MSTAAESSMAKVQAAADAATRKAEQALRQLNNQQQQFNAKQKAVAGEARPFAQDVGEQGMGKKRAAKMAWAQKQQAAKAQRLARQRR